VVAGSTPVRRTITNASTSMVWGACYFLMIIDYTLIGDYLNQINWYLIARMFGYSYTKKQYIPARKIHSKIDIIKCACGMDERLLGLCVKMSI
jgi:hypothetical protein